MKYVIIILLILYAGYLLEMWNYKRATMIRKKYKGYEHLLTDHSYKKAKQKK